MKLFSEKKECCGCGACVDVCKAGAIRMGQDKEGFWYPRVSQLKCKKCGQCSPLCIYDALTYTKEGPQIDPDKCDGCGLCASVCRNDVIEMKKKG